MHQGSIMIAIGEMQVRPMRPFRWFEGRAGIVTGSIGGIVIDFGIASRMAGQDTAVVIGASLDRDRRPAGGADAARSRLMQNGRIRSVGCAAISEETVARTGGKEETLRKLAIP